MRISRFLTRITALCLLALPLSPAWAQNPFAPVVEVNEDVITRYDIDQRQLLMRVISPANAGFDQVKDELINDRLRIQTIRSLGLQPGEEDILEGIQDFASRANLTAEQFLAALQERGVAPETFREFVAVGLAWRDLVRARFASRVSVSEADVDRALAAATAGSGVRVLLSEIIIPAPPEQAEDVLALADEIAQVKTIGGFAQYARQYSATATRDRGGRLNWTPLGNLPPVLRPRILALGVGDVTQPIALENAVALFQLRGIQETDVRSPTYSAIEYAQYFIPGGRSDAALATANKVRAQVDRCDDLYGVAHGQPEEVLVRETRPPAEIPQDIALELAKLDEDEVSTALTTTDGTSLIFLMMCGRSATTQEDVSRDAIATQLRQERLAGLSDSFVEQLRADARIQER